ncbi:MAG: hypothetical protein QM493_03875 [Sulfurovum sp.]
MSFLAKDRDLVLVYSSMDRVSDMDSINVMLTPQFYTLKKALLPVKYAYQAKKIASSIFDGLLENDKSYDYIVFREEDEEEWTLIAYDLDSIGEFLLSKGFVLESISKLFFVQQMVEKFNSPLSLGESEALVLLEGSVVVVPSEALGEDEKPSKVFDNSFTPNSGGVSPRSESNSIITTKQSLILSVIFISFAIIFIIEGIRSNSSSQSNAKMQELFEEYPSLKSSYTRDSIIKKYKKIDIVERKKRDIVKSISAMIFDGVSLGSLDINEKNFKVRLVCKDKRVRKKIKELSSKEGFTTLDISGNNDILVEGKI